MVRRSSGDTFRSNLSRWPRYSTRATSPSALLPLDEAHEHAVHGLCAHGLGTHPGPEVLTSPCERADSDEVEADLDRLDNLEG